MQPELSRAAHLASEYLERLSTCKIRPEADPVHLRARLTKPLSPVGLDPERVIEELARDAQDGLLHSASGRFFGWVIGGALPVSIAADWLTSTWDQNAAAFACSPTAAILEDVAAGWIRDLLGLPPGASYAFVTGCQMAHVTALAAARHSVLADRGWCVETRGLSASPPIRVLAGEHHETLLRALRHLGIGTDALSAVDTRADGTLSPQALERELQRDPEAPTIVALAAGDLNRGRFDPFDELCDLAHAAGAWVHIDGAFGLWAAASPRLKHLVRGVERADSWATDAHKWLNVPYDCGLAFVAHPTSHSAAMKTAAAYKIEIPGERDAFDWGPEWSRRARAIPLYAALRTLGRQGVADLVERCCDLARQLVDGLGELEGVEVLARPIINQGLVRFVDPKGDHDAWTEEVVQRINATGEAWFGPTTWHGMRVMRVSVCNHRTSPQDIDRTLAAVRGALS